MRAKNVDAGYCSAVISASRLLSETHEPFAITPRGITGSRVLITGAGGSIGSELAVQIAQMKPAQLCLVDTCEYNLYRISCAMERIGAFNWQAILGDVRDEAAMRHLFLGVRPEIVFHGAALKHVPLLETDNIVEAVRTNVIGSKVIVDLCLAHGAEFVMISTDKAVNPSSQMGMTKRAAEIYVHDRALRYPEMRVSLVRFGNVIGSSGSVVPLFRAQIAAGGPVTVTHPHMTRYMMTISEAVRLSIGACSLPQDGFALYVLDMGKPISILDLAIGMIKAEGLRPFKDIEIKFVGVRPGEKLVEELGYAWEKLCPTSVSGIRVAQPDFDPRTRMAAFDELLAAANSRNGDWVKRSLRQMIPEYVSADAGVSQSDWAALATKRCARRVWRRGYAEEISSIAALF
ncbi:MULTISPECIES: polysaccharide biosynthesis protein [unclassified Beijerinckia]|uniref:polysaccharide biosynthesis protein n=1 Tax=unclassified Beijerinckia TaxID=2638183 RepID=UPI00147C6C06|nr:MULTISPECIES: polysaccharide biosynthesis protein [unclassified Beijerinckia]